MRLSLTLFRYIFVDLFRVFMMAVGALSGILSFGGLLRPLMQQGLDAGQVGAMLAYFGPAMTAYALPIGALFATTVIYGRLSADNEIVAGRASGLSHLSMAAPAFVLGLIVSLISLGMLLFVVPTYTLKIEQVVSSNIAQLIASRINRTHSVRFGQATVFANQAYLPAPDPHNPDAQTVILENPTIVTYADRMLGLILKAETKEKADQLEKLVTEAIGRGDAKARILKVEVGPVKRQDVEQAIAVNTSKPGDPATALEPAAPAPPDANQAAEGESSPPAAVDIAEAVVIALDVAPDRAARQLAERSRVEIRAYRSVNAVLGDLKTDRRYKVPKDFHLARQATLSIHPDAEGDQLLLTVGLEKGSKFPREFAGAQQGGVERAQFGPMPIPSPIKENTKFMDIWQLQRLFQNSGESRKIRRMVEGYRRTDQMFAFLHHLGTDLNDADGRTVLKGDQTYHLERGEGAVSFERDGELFVTSPDPDDPARRVRFRIVGDAPDGSDDIVLHAREAKLAAQALGGSGGGTAPESMNVDVELYDVEMVSRDGSVGRKAATYGLTVPMPPDVEAVGRRTYRDYVTPGQYPAGGPPQRLFRELALLNNDIQSEIYARISFSLSCLILTVVGCALGMMFKSGNFLSAFAVSFVPALLSITLIVAGQRVCGTVPMDYPKSPNPLQMGLTLIWSGNAVNLLLAIILWWRLQRQ